MIETLIIIIISLSLISLILKFYNISDNLQSLIFLILCFTGIFILFGINISTAAQIWHPVTGLIISIYAAYNYYNLHRIKFENADFDIPIKNSYMFFGGVFLILGVLTLEYFFYDKFIGDFSLLFLFQGIILLSYDYIPSSFDIEKKFTTFFILSILILLVLPSLFLEYALPMFDMNSDEMNSKLLKYLLVTPLANLLSIFGIHTIVDGQILYYETIHDPTKLHRVHIVNSCSGIYSVIVFVSALVAHTLATNNRLHYFHFIHMFLGIIIAYFCNILRMFIIVSVGIYEGDEALFWAHKNVGWIIFLIWVSLFWKFLETNKYYLPIENHEH